MERTYAQTHRQATEAKEEILAANVHRSLRGAHESRIWSSSHQSAW